MILFLYISPRPDSDEPRTPQIAAEMPSHGSWQACYPERGAGGRKGTADPATHVYTVVHPPLPPLPSPWVPELLIEGLRKGRHSRMTTRRLVGFSSHTRTANPLGTRVSWTSVATATDSSRLRLFAGQPPPV